MFHEEGGRFHEESVRFHEESVRFHEESVSSHEGGDRLPEERDRRREEDVMNGFGLAEFAKTPSKIEVRGENLRKWNAHIWIR